MGIGVLIMGKSGSGKSTSLRNFKKGEVGIINVIGKPLPFKNDLPTIETDEYMKILETMSKSNAKSIVIDDGGYIMTNEFMAKHSNAGKGNAVFDLYNNIADHLYTIVNYIKKLPKDKIVYIIFHEDKNDFGDIGPRTIGKLTDRTVCLEGMFSIVLRSKKMDKNYYFYTQSTENDVAKSPMGMFEELFIENDLKMVDDTIREFYNIPRETIKKEEAKDDKKN